MSDSEKPERLSARWRRIALVATLSVLCGAPVLVQAEDAPAGDDPPAAVSPSYASVFNTVPPAANRIAPILRRTTELFQSDAATRRMIKQRRSEQDALKTKLTTINGEFEVLTQHRAQLQQQMVALEAEHQARIQALRQELEAKLKRELADAAAQMGTEFEREVASQVQLFESRQRGEIERLLEQELQLKERELQQVGEELGMQTQELSDRLARLDVGHEVTDQVTRTAAEALAKRRAEFQARRENLQQEREVRVAKAREEFLVRIKDNQAAEQRRRLRIREASLRQAMAELLHNTHLQELSRIEQVRQTFEQVKERYGFLAQEQASLSARIADFDRELAEQARRVETLGLEQQAALTALEQAFQNPKSGSREEVLAWFGQAIGQLPSDLASELGLLQQRVVMAAAQERQLQEQQRVLRERQLAMQVAHEMEAQRQQVLAKQRQEEQAKAQKAEEWLARAEQAGDQGKFDEAIQLVARAQALNPPQLDRVTGVRDQLLAQQESVHRKAKTEELERSFAQAMKVFEDGRYEEAIPLFEQIIAQEAAVEGSPAVKVAGAEVTGGESP